MAASRRVSTLLVIAFSAMAVFVLLSTGEQVVEEVGPGSPAPSFELDDLNGLKASLESLQGRVVFLNFWATWCKPCEEEMPAMERLYLELAGTEFEMIAISVDSSPERVSTFRDDLGLSFPILVDTDKVVANRYQSFKFPETYLIDREGVLVARFIGPREWDSDLYANRVRSLIR